jgi:enhancer of polycomb-like protein
MDDETDEAMKGVEDERDRDDDEDQSEEDWHDTVERWSKLQERWRYDDEGGRWAGLGLCGLGGMEDDDEAIVDDFDQRFMRFRMTLLEEADLMKLSTDLTNVMQAQAAADAPASQPVGYAIYRGETPSMFHQQQAQQQQQQQQMQRQQVQAQAQAAAAALASNSSLAAQLQGQNNMAMNNNAIARAVQTNVGGPLTALQQQQQLHQAQLQMALHQQQQRAAAAMASAQQQGQGVGAASSPRPRSGQQMAMPHPLSQSFGSGNSQSMPGSASPINNGLFPSANLGMTTMPSPQMQAHLAPARPASSASPVLQQRSSPHVQPAASFHSSPAQKHAATPLNPAQGQQQQQRSLVANGALPQINPLAAAAALQQAQAALQAQQQQQQQQGGGGGGQNVPANPSQFSHQLMAMHAALTQNQGQNGGMPMQLKLPANRTRALEMAQQAAKLAAAAQQGQLNPTAGNNAASQAQIGMGLLSNLQQQMNYAQSQQHNFASPAPNNTSNSPKTKSRS